MKDLNRVGENTAALIEHGVVATLVIRSYHIEETVVVHIPYDAEASPPNVIGEYRISSNVTPVVESAGRSVLGGVRREGEQKPTRTHSGRKAKEQAIENRAHDRPGFRPAALASPPKWAQFGRFAAPCRIPLRIL